jgi:hypothetical protein
MRFWTATHVSESQPGNRDSSAAQGVFEPARVREQLECVLASPHFRNSKRYPALLRHVVEHALSGDAAGLKERNLGTDVFGREPNYDPAADPVVRVSASEIRKRLAQYYQDPAHEAELRIQLPMGSYVPEFSEPGATQGPTLVRRNRPWLLPASIVVGLAVLAIVGLRMRHVPDPMEQFWKPVVSPSGNVMLCIGVAGVPARQGGSPGIPGASHGTVSWPDALTLARLGVFLYSRGLAPQFCREDQTTFGDLQQGPAVLIGGLNDEWALRLMENLRFQFRRDGNVFYIADRERPSSRQWNIAFGDFDASGNLHLDHDYAVISRVANPRTGRMTVTLAGLWGYGTLAASQFVTDPKCLQAIAQIAPREWQNKNLQLVIGAEVIDNTPGPPHILAVTTW